jgi:hypothetical protein
MMMAVLHLAISQPQNTNQSNVNDRVSLDKNPQASEVGVLVHFNIH